MIVLFKCDTEKNTKCKKSCCYKRGGRCRLTKSEEFAVKDEKTGKPIIGYMRFDDEPPVIDDKGT